MMPITMDLAKLISGGFWSLMRDHIFFHTLSRRIEKKSACLEKGLVRPDHSAWPGSSSCASTGVEGKDALEIRGGAAADGGASMAGAAIGFGAPAPRGGPLKSIWAWSWRNASRSAASSSAVRPPSILTSWY